MSNPFNPFFRSDKIVVSPLGRLDIFNTYQKVFNCSAAVATRLTNMTKGYSYAFQLLGYLLFEHLNGGIPTLDDIASIEEDYKNNLYNNAYQKIFSELSEMDREYLYAVCGGRLKESWSSQQKWAMLHSLCLILQII